MPRRLIIINEKSKEVKAIDCYLNFVKVSVIISFISFNKYLYNAWIES